MYVNVCFYAIQVSFTHCHHDVSVYPIAKQWYESTSKFDITHSYGLFRRMTGVGGRPEIIIEGSNSQEGPWKVSLSFLVI